jgi:hypothetical protein
LRGGNTHEHAHGGDASSRQQHVVDCRTRGRVSLRRKPKGFGEQIGNVPGFPAAQLLDLPRGRLKPVATTKPSGAARSCGTSARSAILRSRPVDVLTPVRLEYNSLQSRSLA